MSKPLFDPEKHEYRHPVSGVVLPSVTGILEEYRQTEYRGETIYIPRVGSYIPGSIMEQAAEGGQAVHKCLEYAMTLGPNGFTYPDALAPVVEQIHLWAERFKPEILAVELCLYSERYQYAGTMDLVCRINKRLSIIDAKSGEGLLTGPQVAAYLEMYREETGCKEPIDRYKLRLPRDGKPYQFIKLTDPNDWPAFKAKLYWDNYVRSI